MMSAIEVLRAIVNYRRRVGPLGFQLEKLDDYLRNADEVIAADDNAQWQITDLHAMAESNQATIDRLLSEVKALRELADTQAAIITAKNAEIAEMRDDYAGALVNDDEAGMMLAAGQGG